MPMTPYPVILSFNQESRSYLTAHRTSDDIAKSKGEKVMQTACESSCEPVLYLSLAKWKKKDISLVSFQHINLRYPFELTCFNYFVIMLGPYYNFFLWHAE